MFQKLKIRNKLLIIFLIIAAFCLPLNWLVLAVTQEINSRYSTIILQSFLRNEALSEIRRTAEEISSSSGRIKFEEGDTAQAEGTLGADQEYLLLARLEELNQWKDDYEFHVAESNQQSFLDLNTLKDIEISLILQTLKMMDLQENRSPFNTIQIEEQKLNMTQKRLDKLIALSIENEYKFWFVQLNAIKIKSHQLNRSVFIICAADFLLIVILAIFIANKISNPIIALRDVVAKVTEGNYQVRAVNNAKDEIGELSNDINHMITALIDTQKLQIQLMNAEKMASLGQLAAGIAHEINTPIQYVGHNIEFLRDSFKEMVAFSQSVVTSLKSQSPSEAMRTIQAEFNTIDMDYLNREIPATIKQSMEGIAQVSKIIKSMNEFSHPGSTVPIATDLNRALDNTLEVTKNVWKNVAKIQKELSPDLPLVDCYPNEINQVFMNLIVNAAHAIETNHESSAENGIIKIQSRFDNDNVEILISDTGTGIPANIQSKIFDPFFTTKEVGKGTGQGLAIAHVIVEKRHQGQLTFNTTLGKGTTFVVRLPIRNSTSGHS